VLNGDVKHQLTNLKRGHVTGEADFSLGKVIMTLASREQCSKLWQSRWCCYWFMIFCCVYCSS